MGLGGISIWQLLIILLVVVLLFGSKKLRNLGPDLGAAIRGFRKGMRDDGKKSEEHIAAAADGGEEAAREESSASSASSVDGNGKPS